MIKEGRIKIIKLAPPPPGLPIYGRVNPDETSFIGRTNYVAALEEKKFIFGIKRSDRFRHILIAGKSGVGKSKLIELMARQDIISGFGLGLIDSTGDTFEAILDFIPKSRLKDAVIIDLTDQKQPPIFNFFSGVSEELKHHLQQGLTEIMKSNFGGDWQPPIEYLFQMLCAACFDYPQAAWPDMIRLLSDSYFRQTVAAAVKDETVKKFWEADSENWLKKFDANAVIPLLNRINQFLTNPYLRNVLTQRNSKINFKNFIDQKKIILINLAKDKIGEKNANFFGSLLALHFKLAFLNRRPAAGKPDFYLYFDDFQSFPAGDFDGFLRLAKNGGLGLAFCVSNVEQLLEPIRLPLLSNAGTLIVFRVNSDDVGRLKTEMSPIFDVKDMLNLGLQEFYIKITIDDEVSDPFSAETLKITPLHRSFKNEIIVFSRQKYGAPFIAG